MLWLGASLFISSSVHLYVTSRGSIKTAESIITHDSSETGVFVDIENPVKLPTT